MIWFLPLLLLALAVLLAMPHLITILTRKALLDIPNERSSHDVPVPRGGGWLALGPPVICLIMAVIFMPLASSIHVSLIGLAVSLILLMGISALDDKYSLSPILRLGVQFLAAGITVFTLPESVRVLPLLGLLPEKIILILGFVWMINLTNFIDGINGITAVNGLLVAAGLGFASYFLPDHPSAVVFPLGATLIAGGLIGFLPYNIPQARIFLGDVGSVPLGLWQAYGLSFIAASFGLIPALLLCLYPLTDATITLIKRALERKKIWTPHREHYYQKAVQNGRTHARTSTLIAGYNILCLSLTALAMLYPVFEYGGLGIALISLVFLLREFQKPAKEG